MKLFEPLAINGMPLANRIIMPPMQLRLGLGNRRARTFYLERAAGGVGAIVMSATSVDLFSTDAAWGRPGGVEQFIERMQVLNNEIRAAGARVGIQLWHGNQWPAGSGAPFAGTEQVAPSATAERRALTTGEIEAIVDKFGQAAETARTAGFDFVEVHGAHGYLVCQFFSSADNQRNDRYGGNLDNRMRFGLEIVETMRRAAGDDFPIFFRLGAEERRPGGITLRQSKAFAAALTKAGVDALDVSIGMPVGRKPSPGRKARPGTYVPLAAAIKQTVGVPVMAVGRIHTAALAESILNEGRADLVGVGRQLIADPRWPRKILEGREDDIVACLSCNTCFNPLRNDQWRPGDPICQVNPRAGREADEGRNQ